MLTRQHHAVAADLPAANAWPHLKVAVLDWDLVTVILLEMVIRRRAECGQECCSCQISHLNVASVFNVLFFYNRRSQETSSFSINPRDGCVGESQISSFWNTWAIPQSTNNDAMSLKSPFIPILMLSLSFNKSTHLNTPSCMPADWLIRYLR